MEEVITLNDSDESSLSTELNDEGINNADNNKQKPLSQYSDASDFEFPEVKFDHPVKEIEVISLCEGNNEKNLFNSDDNVSSYETHQAAATSRSIKYCNVRVNVINSPDSPKESEKDEIKEKKKRGKPPPKRGKKQLTEEELDRQKQLMKEKALKTIALKKIKNLKPGECMKSIEVVLDRGIEKSDFIKDIVNTLLDADIRYSIDDVGLFPNSITWKRTVEHYHINESNEISATKSTESVNEILIIWNWDEVVTKVANESFCHSVSNARSCLPDYNIILVIFGIEGYFTKRKQRKNSGRNETKNYPEISRKKLETYLNEVQIIDKCNSRLIDSSENLALMVYQCTKAIAEIPYKSEKDKNLKNKFDWYVMGDNKNCVKVDKDGNGLRRLWQQQLCQFTLSSLEIAEAICSVYPTPADLLEAYMNCTNDEGLNLLKDIPIRRAAGPLATVRKVGPELSKKIYLMFTSRDGETVLN